MPFTQFLILKIPTLVLGLTLVSGAVLLSILGLLAVRRLTRRGILKEHHDVAGPIFGVLGAMYAVLLAFVVVSVWQSYDKTNANVQQEANYLADIYRDAEAFAPEFREKVARLTREYRQSVINKEWKTLARGEMSPEVENLMRQIWALYTTYEPQTFTQKSFFDESVHKLNSFRELRRQRLMDSQNGLPGLLWVVLIAGALTTVSFTFLFETGNPKGQVVMVALFSALVALILLTILLMDFPFTGDITVPFTPFQQLLLD